PAPAAGRAEPAGATAEPGGRLLLLVRDGRGDEHLVADHDRARPAVPGNRDLPGDVLVLAPLGRQLRLVADGRAVRPAESGPVGGAQGRGKKGEDEDGRTHGRLRRVNSHPGCANATLGYGR